MTFENVLPKALLLSLLTALAIALASGGSPAQAASSCNVDSVHYPSIKGGYFLILRVTKISCKTGKSLMKAHYSCRVKHGIKGKCSAVRGYRCTEKRGLADAQEFDAQVTCKRGAKRFVYAYQQNT